MIRQVRLLRLGPASDHPRAWRHLSFFSLWVTLIVFCFRRAMSLGPGRVRGNGSSWKVGGDDRKCSKRDDDDDDVDGIDEDAVRCDRCNGAPLPPRAHHCAECGRCSLKMDHHCPWINTCVGAQNQPHFLAFVLTVPPGCAYAAYICGVYLLFRYRQRQTTGISDHTDYIVLFAFGLAIGVAVAVAVLAVVQVMSIVRNRTEVEDLVVRRARRAREKRVGTTTVQTGDRSDENGASLHVSFP